jgi:TonB family protein
MATRACFLSKDEKALDAVSQVLSDLEVSFESFQDSSFAVKRVAAQHFDMILVDCDNEQTATQVFASAKNSSINQSSISIAIVDGKSGVANAFRLGASLVLSKPISIEQARGTLRNALAMVRKTTPEAPKSAPVSQAPTPVITAPIVTAPASIAAPISKPTPAQPVKPVSEPTRAAMTAAPAPKISESLLKTTLHPSTADTLHLAEEGASPTKASKSKSISLISDESPLSVSKHPAPPMFGMVTEKEKSSRKTRPFLLAAVAIALVAAGVYGYSMVNPGFQSLIMSQYTSLQAMVGIAPKPQLVAAVPRPTPPKPSVAAAQPSTTAAAGTGTAANTQQPDGFAQPADNPPSQGFASAAPQKSTAPVILSTSATTVQKPATESEPLVLAEDVADSHVAYRVQPAYPEAAHKKGVKGNVVLTANVDKDGKVASVEVVSGNAQLASAAVAAVKQWRYEAYYHDGQPAEFQTQVTVRFPQPAVR